MIYSSRLVIVYTLFLSIFISCVDIINDSNADNQKYYFEVEYGNAAWGYVLTGWYISNDGEVFSYSYKNSAERWRPANSDQPTGSELDDKYSHLKTLIDTIPNHTLLKYTDLIKTSINGTYSDTVTQGFDMGIQSIICFTYDNDVDIYYKHILKINGNYTYENVTSEAQEIIRWLDGINKNNEY